MLNVGITVDKLLDDLGGRKTLLQELNGCLPESRIRVRLGGHGSDMRFDVRAPRRNCDCMCRNADAEPASPVASRHHTESVEEGSQFGWADRRIVSYGCTALHSLFRFRARTPARTIRPGCPRRLRACHSKACAPHTSTICAASWAR